jgi:glycine betaine/proline transport system ATP-binding protein
MQDGAIVQIGSPEELVLSPATDYVAEFTQQIPRAKVLTAKSIMKPVSTGSLMPSSFNKTVRSDARIQSFAADVVHDDEDIGVLNESGELVGRLAPNEIIDVLVSGTSET